LRDAIPDTKLLGERGLKTRYHIGRIFGVAKSVVQDLIHVFPIRASPTRFGCKWRKISFASNSVALRVAMEELFI